MDNADIQERILCWTKMGTGEMEKVNTNLDQVYFRELKKDPFGVIIIPVSPKELILCVNLPIW